ncbi:hypothetical protein [Herbiconiux sp. VKM Ac-2851]|uniref:hypothetical protein n=1 Tax=Herbiconiux sp. VKM Ac-2851 TaxID=2739025 RepID=UPI0015646E7A|nr:hypothetical protein [Herbiconiux sp. VKM Ac-2851]NQX36440.1 hypothetical protein [Herbiconiux sp. VKM Ac-2851]
MSERDLAIVRTFGFPVYLSRDTEVEFVGLSSQSHNGRVDVVEASYVTPPRSDHDCDQPSIWTWRAGGLDPAGSLRIHASTHLTSHRADFRSGAHIPSSAEMDSLGDAIEASPRRPISVTAGELTLGGWGIDLDGWTLAVLRASGALVTIAGRREFAEKGLLSSRSDN